MRAPSISMSVVEWPSQVTRRPEAGRRRQARRRVGHQRQRADRDAHLVAEDPVLEGRPSSCSAPSARSARRCGTCRPSTAPRRACAPAARRRARRRRRGSARSRSRSGPPARQRARRRDRGACAGGGPSVPAASPPSRHRARPPGPAQRPSPNRAPARAVSAPSARRGPARRRPGRGPANRRASRPSRSRRTSPFNLSPIGPPPAPAAASDTGAAATARAAESAAAA